MIKTGFYESVDTFKVKFEGKSTIDAELFTKVINGTVDLVKAAANAIDPNAFLRLEIRATKEGSFETIIDAVAKYSIDLITKENTRLACEIVRGYFSFLQIKSHLKGRKPKKIETIAESSTITNHDNQQITAPANIVNCYFNGSKIDNSIVQVFTDLGSSDRLGIIIERPNEQMSFTKDDYAKMSSPITQDDNPTALTRTTQIIKECELIIKKPDLMGDSKWQVILDRKIDVKISDEEFLLSIRNGEIKISGGSMLVCDLEILNEMDDKYNSVNVEYIVHKLHGIKDKETQLNLC